MTSSAPSSGFERLDERIRRWIWAEGWTELRDAQERAIHAIILGVNDVIIAAATATGKTEAAFLPILTDLLKETGEPGLVLYVSPLKALINDQFGRLERLCESLEISVWPWHGDISASSKTKFIKRPAGVLLITPESLEAVFCNRGFGVSRIFANLRFVVVDELHAFIGTERGKQLQSLLHRVQEATGKPVPRIGLSATLGDMRLAAEFLRPRAGDRVEIIESKSSSAELKLLIKGYIEPAVALDKTRGSAPMPAAAAIASHLFSVLRGSNNLVFPNSRAEVEHYTYRLRSMCEDAGVPNEFWPHHGNLARETREDTERALKSRETPATAVCTNTLELGIDIGAVKSVAQIGPPPTVAGLRQRLGRSGRRAGEAAILRGYVIEEELTADSHPMSQLRDGLFQFAATVSLLLEGWFEPPHANGMHLSTLVQQILSLIAQHGGITAAGAFKTLCAEGPFSAVSKTEFIELLRSLGQKELIEQEPSGVLLHGAKGELQVNHYSFYAAFASEEEYRLVSEARTLGSLPVSTSVGVGDFILFGGRTWRVEQVDDAAKLIQVTSHVTGKAPLFSSAGGAVHERIRVRMRELYESSADVPFLDATAKTLLAEGRAAYQRFGLHERQFLRVGSTLLLFTWLGDDANEVLMAMLRKQRISGMSCGPALELSGPAAQTDLVIEALQLYQGQQTVDVDALLRDANNLVREKWDWALTESELVQTYASLHMNIPSALAWLQELQADDAG